MTVPIFESFDWFNKKAPWLPLVRKILGEDVKQIQTACARFRLPVCILNSMSIRYSISSRLSSTEVAL